MLKNKLLAATSNSDEPLYSDSVFACHTYTGNGSTQTITNGIDLSGQGGMVWSKVRTAGSGNDNRYLYDTARGASVVLYTNLTNAQATTASDGVTAFNSNGYAIGASRLSANTYPYVSWTFRKSPRFFDVVTYTGNGVAGRQIPHALGIAPGMVIVKATNEVNAWVVWNRGIPDDGLFLNLTNAKLAGAAVSWFGDGATSTINSTVFAVGGADSRTNTSAVTYVAYLFAHDASTDGIVQCGGYTGTAVSGNFVSLGWEPQYVLIKANSNESWLIYDSARGVATGGLDAWLKPDQNFAESPQGDWIDFNATGFTLKEINNNVNGSGIAYIYLAIRRPNKPPTVGTQVFEATTSSAFASTLKAPDLWIVADRNASSFSKKAWINRLVGMKGNGSTTCAPYLASTTADAESSSPPQGGGYEPQFTYTKNNGDFNIGGTGGDAISWLFQRAPGVMDIVCYTGTGVAKTEAHNLGVVPELMIVKSRSNTSTGWPVYAQSVGAGSFAMLNTVAASNVHTPLWNNTAPTASVFTVGSDTYANQSAANYVAYLFATKAGISKCGSYTGNGSTNTINCGFTTGARFVLIKRTDSTGDWYVWDTVRGIIAGNDPYLLLNSTAAEVTSTDYIDPSSTGFELSSTAPAAINASGGTFIYLAFA